MTRTSAVLSRSLPQGRLPQALLIALATLAAAPAFAEDAAADPTTLDKIVVKGERAEGYSVRRTSAGTRFDLAPREIPQSVSIISHQRIEDQNLDDIIDVLANTTGVSSTQSDTERTEFYSRGFYIDSYQYDNLPTQMVQNWSYGDSGLDLALYDRVEVVRGATGLLTGAGNPSASVNLIRKHADSAELTGSVSVNVGSWGRTRSTVDVTTAQRQRLGARPRDRQLPRHRIADGSLRPAQDAGLRGHRRRPDPGHPAQRGLRLPAEARQRRYLGWFPDVLLGRDAHPVRRIVRCQSRLDLLGHHQQAPVCHAGARFRQ